MTPKEATYTTGQTIEVGDRILYMEGAGVIESVITDKIFDAGLRWYYEELGAGILLTAKGFGAVYLSAASGDIDDDLVFLSRGEMKQQSNEFPF